MGVLTIIYGLNPIKNLIYKYKNYNINLASKNNTIAMNINCRKHVNIHNISNINKNLILTDKSNIYTYYSYYIFFFIT